MLQHLFKSMLEILRNTQHLSGIAKPLSAAISIAAVLLVAGFVFLIARLILLKVVRTISRKTATKWDDILLQHKVFNALAHLIPAIILYQSSGFASPSLLIGGHELQPSNITDYYPGLEGIMLIAIKIYFIFIFVKIFSAFLNAANDIYNTTPFAQNRPIKGYLQLIKILIYFLSGILVIATLLERDPTALIAGLGAMAAVLLLVFKDTILGFVASIQLSANEMVKIGDWIEMPGHRADGTVIDITLNTVKVQNWDRTITTIPTYALVSESFNNWKGMEASGGRRIKRSVYIDVNSIHFVDTDLLGKFDRFELLRDYVRAKEEEIRNHNKSHNIADEDVISGRKQTNIGIFRKYLELYLRNNPKIRKDMTFLVRQLQPTEKGLPIEIYVFSADTAWTYYENIQSDLFDHILAVIPEFGLKVFQSPSGSDVRDSLKALSGQLKV